MKEYIRHKPFTSGRLMGERGEIKEALKVEITNDEEAQGTIDDIISDLKDMKRKSDAAIKSELKNIKISVDDLIKYYR
jgi:hypothetical protein